MALPFSRNTNYAANDPAKGNDLNAIQDAIVDGRHHSEVGQFFPAIRGSTLNHTAWISTGVQTYTLMLDSLKRGDRVISLRHYFQYIYSAATTLEIAILEQRAFSNMGSVALGSAWTSTDIASEANSTFLLVEDVNGSGTPYTLTVDALGLLVQFKAPATNYWYWGTLVTWDRP